MKAKFLIDVNLPYYFSLLNKEDYVHQFDLGDEWSDEEIWEYAIKKVNVFEDRIEAIN